MAYVEHDVVKPQVIADSGVAILGKKTTILNRFTKEVPDRFFGAAGDKVTVRVPGTLPARTYGWRNDRSQPIKTDVYQETTVDITVNADDLYSAVRLTDEQKAFDFGGSFGRLTDAQTDAIAESLNRRALRVATDLPFEYALGVNVSRAAVVAAAEINQDVFFNAFVDAGKAMNRMRVPFSERTALVGAQVAAEIQKSQKLVQIVGDNSGSPFSNAVLGVYAGFTIVEDANVDPDEALVVSKTGIAFWNYAPAVPDGAKKGAISSKDGISMRWLMDYDTGYQMDRSSWNTWFGFRHVEDMLVQINEDETQMMIGTEKYFTRGIKLIFTDGNGGWAPGDGTDKGPEGRKGAPANSELAKVWNNQPFTGTLPEGEDYPQVLATLRAELAELRADIEGDPVTP
jgi:hypothetical protein